MQIDELASIENIQSIASANGLSYNNSNIKTVSYTDLTLPTILRV